MTIELFFVLIVGLCFGSFVTLVSYRLPQGEDIVVKPSRCPNCDTKLRFLDLWPVLSWLLSRGRCRYCKVAVSARYPMTELATAAGFLLAYSMFGWSLQTLLLCMMWVALMVMIVVDFEHYLIPDEIHYVLLPLGIGYQFLVGGEVESVIGGCVAGAMLGLSLHYGYRYLRKKEGLGFGDVKFFAVAGIWLGLKPFVPFLFFSGLFGIVTGIIWRILGKGPIFPFGPALAVSLFLCIVFSKYANLLCNIGQHLQ